MTSIIPSILPSIFPSIEGSILSAFGAPSLLLDFARNAYSMGAIGSVPSDRTFASLVTFSRASSGGRINAAGEFEWVGNDVPRLTYDPVTLQPLGLLIEDQRTNLLLRSTLEGGTAGTIGSGAVAPTGWLFGAPAPAGDVSYPVTSLGTIGVRFQAVAQRPTIRQTFAVAASLPYCLSGRITALTGSLTIQDVVQYANAPAGATTTWLKNGVAVAGTSPVASGDFVAAVLTVAATAGNADARFGPGGSSNVTCDCTMTMPQVEQASAPSTYIPTTTAQVTRAADSAAVNTLSPWYNAAAGTPVAEFIRGSIEPSQAFAALRGASNSTISLESGSGTPGQLRMRVNNAGVQQAIPVGASFSDAGVMYKMAGAYAADFFSVSVNGALPSTDISGTVPTVTMLEIGMLNTVARINGIISRIIYYPRVIDVQQASA